MGRQALIRSKNWKRYRESINSSKININRPLRFSLGVPRSGIIVKFQMTRLTPKFKHVILPATMGMVDQDFEDGKHANWPPFPWFVRPLARFYYNRRHAGACRFSPCWMGKKRDLKFVDEGSDSDQTFHKSNRHPQTHSITQLVGDGS